MELSGPQAFYNQPQYEQITRKELQDHFPHEKPAIVFEKGARWVRLTTEVIFNGSSLALIYCVTSYCLEKISSRLSLPKLPKGVIWITIPIGVYNHLYIGVGWLVHWGSQPWLSYDHERCSIKRGELFEKAEVVKRLNIQANGCSIDTIIMGKKENFDKGRWLIVSLGSGERYEELYDSYLMLAEKLNANLLLYNYPSYGASGGYLPNKAAILAAHQAMHFFAREMLKAREIVDIGNSIGGGVQGESLKDLVLAEQVKYVFLKHMTFARLSGVADDLVINHAGFLISFLNWEYSCIESSKTLQHREIIIQAGDPSKHCRVNGFSIIISDLEALRQESFEPLTDTNQLVENDGVIPADKSCAKALFDDPSCPKDKKVFLAGKYLHTDVFNSEKLADIIETQLKA